MIHQTDSYDLLSPEAFDDPYPLYHQMRSEAPVYWSERLRAWILTSFDAVKAMLDHPDVLVVPPISFAEHVSPQQQVKQRRISEFLNQWIIYQNPPGQTLMHQLLGHGFKAIEVKDLRPRMQVIVDELLDEWISVGEMDLIWDFGFPFGVSVITEILGVPSSDLHLFKAWAPKLRAANNGHIDDPAVIDDIDRTIETAKAYLAELVAERQSRPRADVTSGLNAFREQGRLTEEALVSNLLLLLFGGQETSMHLIGNGVVSLLRHPDQCHWLKQNPGMIRVAVEELLRYESPSPLAMRVAAKDLILGGQPIRAGQKIFGMLGAANRDPDRFPDPDRLDLSRQPNVHLAFGHGAHVCLGGALARLEGQVVFNTLLHRLTDLHLTVERVAWHHSIAVRGPSTLPITFAAEVH
ncbi:MAG: cytochrome P450 [Gammaproteobacteria bacterium]